MVTLVRRSLLGLALTLGCAAAFATPITFQYTATLDSAQFNSSYGGTAPAQVGDRLVFTYTFQSDAAPSPVFPWRTWYSGQGPLLAEVYRGGARIGSWAVPLIDITLVDNLNTGFQGFVGYDDRYEVSGSVPDAGAGELPFAVRAYLVLVDHGVLAPSNVIQGTALPLAPPDPSSFGYAKLFISRVAEVPVGGGVSHIFQHWNFDGWVDGFRLVSAVPEPATLPLLVAALMGMAARHRLRHPRPRAAGPTSAGAPG